MEKEITKRIRVGRMVYLLLACLFAACVFVQIFIAGMGTFVNPVNWAKHVLFIHLFGFNLPLLLLIAAFAGSLPRWAYWQLLGLFVLIFSMYFTANMTQLAPWLGALHPVMAMLLAAVAILKVNKVSQLVFKKKGAA